nr:translation initiation factor IF-2-like [Gorilla gorilla gorilla]
MTLRAAAESRDHRARLRTLSEARPGDWERRAGSSLCGSAEALLLSPHVTGAAQRSPTPGRAKAAPQQGDGGARRERAAAESLGTRSATLGPRRGGLCSRTDPALVSAGTPRPSAPHDFRFPAGENFGAASISRRQAGAPSLSRAGNRAEPWPLSAPAGAPGPPERAAGGHSVTGRVGDRGARLADAATSGLPAAAAACGQTRGSSPRPARGKGGGRRAAGAERVLDNGRGPRRRLPGLAGGVEPPGWSRERAGAGLSRDSPQVPRSGSWARPCREQGHPAVLALQSPAPPSLARAAAGRRGPGGATEPGFVTLAFRSRLPLLRSPGPEGTSDAARAPAPGLRDRDAGRLKGLLPRLLRQGNRGWRGPPSCSLGAEAAGRASQAAPFPETSFWAF